MIDELIQRCDGSPVAAAKLLGVAYRGSFCAYRNGSRPIPAYIEASLRAHLALSDRAFQKLRKDSN